MQEFAEGKGKYFKTFGKVEPGDDFASFLCFHVFTNDL